MGLIVLVRCVRVTEFWESWRPQAWVHLYRSGKSFDLRAYSSQRKEGVKFMDEK